MRQPHVTAIIGAGGGLGLALCMAAAADETALAGIQLNPEMPEWVHLIPAGAVEGRDGRFWRLSDAEAVIAATAGLKMDLPIDYDHATDLAPAGAANPAAGWIKQLQVREDGIWGRVDWTEKGAAAVKAGEYRYLSPVFRFDKKSKEIRQLLRAALTNNPALYLKAVASHEGVQMDKFLKQLRQLLGLAEDADEKAVCAAVEKLAKAGEAMAVIAKAAGLGEDADFEAIAAAAADRAGDEGETLTGIAKALGLEETATAEEIETAAAKATAAAAKAGDRDELAARLAKLEEDGATAKAEASADAAIKAGKLTPAQRDWAIGLAKKDGKAFAEFLAGQPVIVKPGQTVPGGKPGSGDGALDDEDVAVAKVLGLDPKAFKKTRDEEENV